jgi:hypothetical protein
MINTIIALAVGVIVGYIFSPIINTMISKINKKNP